jgi:hypothetical protein
MPVFWKFKLDNGNKDNYGKTLFQIMKEKNVNIYLASHHHSAHVLAFNYNLDTPLDQFVKQDQVLVSNGCFGTCDANSPFTQEFFTKKDAKGTNKAEQWLYIFVIGNSGRFLDPLETDQRTRGVLLWGRGNNGSENLCSDPSTFNKKFGGANFSFNKDSVKVNFFEVGKASDTKVDIANITISNKSGDNNFASRFASKFSTATPSKKLLKKK